MNTVLIRADSGVHIGTGHVMRCLTLARQLKALNADVVFICRNHLGNINDLVKREFQLLELSAQHSYTATPQLTDKVPHAHWLGVSELDDAEQSTNAVNHAKLNVSWCLVDHFSIGEVWETQVAATLGCKIVVVDGLLDHKHACDLLIDPTLNIFNQHKYQKMRCSQVLTGPANMPLRDEFRQINPRRRQLIQRILVCFGGVDSNDMTLRICQLLSANITLQQRDIKVHVVVGQQYPSLQTLLAFCAENPLFVVHVQTSDMALLMLNSDLAIGAGGTMAWERCAAALPAIVVSIAQNQLMQNKELEHVGAVLHVGEDTEGVLDRVSTAMMGLINDPQQLSTMSDKARQIMAENEQAFNWLHYIAGVSNNEK